MKLCCRSSNCPLALLIALIFFHVGGVGYSQEAFPNTQPLTLQGDLSVQMVAGIDRFLTSETQRAIEERQKLWQRDFSSAAAYDKSISRHRDRLRQIIGAVDPRL